jgi:hypothetical protein
LICQPAKRSERNKAVGPDHDEAAKAMSDARETSFTVNRANAVFDDKMPTVDAYCDSVTEKC